MDDELTYEELQAELDRLMPPHPEDCTPIKFKRHRFRRFIAWLMFWRRAKFITILPGEGKVRKVDVKFYLRDDG